jgi:hypothetical protein
LISSNKLLPAHVWLAQNPLSDSWWPGIFSIFWMFSGPLLSWGNVVKKVAKEIWYLKLPFSSRPHRFLFTLFYWSSLSWSSVTWSVCAFLRQKLITHNPHKTVCYIYIYFDLLDVFGKPRKSHLSNVGEVLIKKQFFLSWKIRLRGDILARKVPWVYCNSISENPRNSLHR